MKRSGLLVLVVLCILQTITLSVGAAQHDGYFTRLRRGIKHYVTGMPVNKEDAATVRNTIIDFIIVTIPAALFLARTKPWIKEISCDESVALYKEIHQGNVTNIKIKIAQFQQQGKIFDPEAKAHTALEKIAFLEENKKVKQRQIEWWRTPHNLIDAEKATAKIKELENNHTNLNNEENKFKEIVRIFIHIKNFNPDKKMGIFGTFREELVKLQLSPEIIQELGLSV